LQSQDYAAPANLSDVPVPNPLLYSAAHDRFDSVVTHGDASIAIVVPWMYDVGGHRVSIGLARELAAKGNRVRFFVGRMHQDLRPLVTAGLGLATLDLGRVIRPVRTSMLKFARYQYSRALDREVAWMIAKRHAESPFDLVFVVSNEGHWLPGYLRSVLRPPFPTTAVCVRELVEHPFWLGYERKRRLARTLFSSLYPLAHEYEIERLRTFDKVFSISSWTSLLLDYFYGIRDVPAFAIVDRMFFEVPINGMGSTYIAVPTAALDRRGVEWVQAVYRHLPALRTFGRRPVPGVPHAGYLSDSELVSFLAGASATLFLFDYEALGLLPLESLATGTPVVTFPKQGVWAEHASNPGVRFGERPEQLIAGLMELSRLSTDPAWRLTCRRSVMRFHPDEAIASLWARLDSHALQERPPPEH